jgi:nucleoside-diphosphate-sugar epimerase
LITGGAGFLGSLLKKALVDRYRVVSVDLQEDDWGHPNFTAVRGDIRDRRLLGRVARDYHFSGVFHLAAQMPHAVKTRRELWATNVDGTRNVAEMAKKYGIGQVIFVSTNCVWGKNFARPVREDDVPCPAEIYGESKVAAEEILGRYGDDFRSVIFRCPPIIDDGRAGNIAILFDFVRENRKLWMVGRGDNRYQLIYARDLIDAMMRGIGYGKSNVFGIGADDIPTLRETYDYIIKKSGSASRPACFPAGVIRPVMKIAGALGLSPLGIYFQEMIDKDFAFDTARVKAELGWRPTLNNSQMLYRAYAYYVEHLDGIKIGDTNNARARMGVIRLLKWLS